jgi:hypothetical protein
MTIGEKTPGDGPRGPTSYRDGATPGRLRGRKLCLSLLGRRPVPSHTRTRPVVATVTVMVPTGFVSMKVLAGWAIPSGEMIGVAVAASWTSGEI